MTKLSLDNVAREVLYSRHYLKSRIARVHALLFNMADMVDPVDVNEPQFCIFVFYKSISIHVLLFI